MRRLSESIVTAGDIATFDLVKLNPDMDASFAAGVLNSTGLSVAPLGPGPITRYATFEGLSGSDGTVLEASRPIGVDMVVANGTPLRTLLSRFKTHDHLFVLDAAEIKGVVAHADLQLPIVGMPLLGLVVTLEQALSHLIEEHTFGQWLELLPASAQETVRDVYADRQRHNTDISMIECLNLTHRLTIAGSIPAIRTGLGYASATSFKRFCRHTANLRNVIAHGTGLLGASSDPIAAIEHFETIAVVAARAAALADGGELTRP